jgi:hypothetical protein
MVYPGRVAWLPRFDAYTFGLDADQVNFVAKFFFLMRSDVPALRNPNGTKLRWLMLP